MCGSVNGVRKVDHSFKEKEAIAEENYINNILQLVKEIKYGSITLIIQDEEIVQIDTNKKIRLK